MILLNILKKKKKKVENLIIEKNFKDKLLNLSNHLKKFKTFKSTEKGLISNDKKGSLAHKGLNVYVSYIISVNITLTNTIINITNTKGDVIISMSSGNVNLISKQKKQQPLALISLFKALIKKAKFLNNQPIALHFKNTKIFYESLVINLLQTKYYIVSIQSYNLSPHNGCRPKKLKRTKIRTKRKVLR